MSHELYHIIYGMYVRTLQINMEYVLKQYS